MLTAIAREVFAIPASNTAVERLFSSAKHTVDDKRTRLSIEKIDRLLFLQRNEIAFKRLHSSIGSHVGTSESLKRKCSDGDFNKHDDNSVKKRKEDEPNIFDELFDILGREEEIDEHDGEDSF